MKEDISFELRNAADKYGIDDLPRVFEEFIIDDFDEIETNLECSDDGSPPVQLERIFHSGRFDFLSVSFQIVHDLCHIVISKYL